MRLIRYKISPPVVQLLREVAQTHGIDRFLAQDLYALQRLRGSGIPSTARIKVLAKAIIAKTKGRGTVTPTVLAASTTLAKRAQQLKEMSTATLFKSLFHRRDSVDAIRQYFTSFQMLYRKNREAQCVSCKLKSSCDFGKQYGKSVRDISKVVDPDFARKAHVDCPSLPDIDKTQQMVAAAELFKKMCAQSAANQVAQNIGKEQNYTTAGLDKASAPLKQATKIQAKADKDEEPDEDDSDEKEQEETTDPDSPIVLAGSDGATQPHAGIDYEATHTGGNDVILIDLINKLATANLLVFDLGKKFSLALSAQKTGKFAPTPTVDKSVKGKQMDSLSDLPKLVSSQHGLPQEIFDQKLERKQLVKQDHQKQEDKKKMLYFIIDNSGSMSGWLGAGTTKILTRSALAQTLCLAVSARVKADKGILYTRFFADGVSALYHARTADEFERLDFLLASAKFNGGGTNILMALEKAVLDIDAAKDEISTAEILCVTDCEDTFDVSSVKRAIGTREFNVLDVSGKAFTDQGASGQLRSCATKYMKADETAVDVDKIINLI